MLNLRITPILGACLILALPGSPAFAQVADQAAQQPTNTAPSPDGLEMPQLAYTATPEVVADYDKYFYFHRDGTSFAEAYTDIRECDALSSGISFYLEGSDSMYATGQYGLGGVIGGVIGDVLADAIFGSAERRKIRRTNLRNCMGYKGYSRYGISGELWKTFNFEEGNGRKKEAVRERAIRLQAMVASGPKPTTEALPQ
ncbi:hypothetical protein [Novosphingobium sp.]|uniref:hypothetical protein n=1 Tax=Novosphingobium sp. TaxID=1874826 RepID=UPI0035AF5D1C